MMNKIALAMIVKGTDDEAPHLRRALESVKDHVDGIFLNVNHKPGEEVSQKVMDVWNEQRKGYKGMFALTRTEWHDDFAEARNANLAQVPEDFTHILWLDTDDTIDKPKKIREVVNESDKFDAIYVDYLYDKDEAGNPMTVHMVARIFKNNGSHQWKGRIHETLIETRGAAQGATKDFTVIHHADEDRKNRSLERNIKLLEKQLEEEMKDPDPRTMYYLGCTYLDAGYTDSAKQLLNDYLTLSGWDQERAAAHTKLGKQYVSEGNRAEAKQHFMLAIGEDPGDPEPRVDLGSLELEMKQYKKAEHWLLGVTKMDKAMRTLEHNPMSYTFRTYLLLADVYLNMGGKYIDTAYKWGKKALAYKKTDKDIKNYVNMLGSLANDRRQLEEIVKSYKAAKEKKNLVKAEAILKSIPPHLADNPVVAALRNEQSFTWPAKSIAIMTGDTVLDSWGPWSLKDGIGGSEEAIIRLSKHLADLGYKVVVYAKPGINTGLDDSGVMWRNFWDCNLNDEFDIFVAWRNPGVFDREINARKKYLWLHDVMEPGEFTETRIANFDKCILLSKYHRSLFPMIPDEKVLMSGNGIDPDEFKMPYAEPKSEEEYDANKAWLGTHGPRDPHKILYASSHVRGLAYIYEIWPEVKKAVPDATLDVYYGRESYDAVHKGNPERMKWMDDMIQKAKDLEGVTDHGKASQATIVEQGFKSGIWAYPCPFPEIYCITAIKSQASGAVPVASNYAALDETIQFGHKQTLGEFDEADLEKYKESLIWWLQHPEEQEKVRPKMMEWARSISWRAVGEGWVEDFES